MRWNGIEKSQNVATIYALRMGCGQGAVERVQAFGELRRSSFDLSRHYGETRVVALGLDSNGVALNVVYTVRGEAIRIISAWKASKHEREAYTEARADRPLQKR
jgi:uncharacterized protein